MPLPDSLQIQSLTEISILSTPSHPLLLHWGYLHNLHHILSGFVQYLSSFPIWRTASQSASSSWSVFCDFYWLSSLLHNFSHSSSGSFQASCWCPSWHSVAVTCMSPCLGPLTSPAPLTPPERAILLTWSAARIAVPLTSSHPSSLIFSLPCHVLLHILSLALAITFIASDWEYPI